MTLAAALGLMGEGGANLSFLRILRMLRVLRMLRLMKSWKGLYKICMTFIKALPQMSNLFVLTANHGPPRLHLLPARCAPCATLYARHRGPRVYHSPLPWRGAHTALSATAIPMRASRCRHG
eukprot:2451353-Prymnesium_polylepis.1